MARVEGEGALTIRLRDGRVDDVQLRIFEAPRFFEALLRGRSIAEVPDITARICGICPVAYQMSACHALGGAPGHYAAGPIAGAAAAALLRRVDREPCAAHRLPARSRLPGLRKRLRHGPRPTGIRRPAARRAGTEEGRQRHRRAGGWPRDPSDQRAARRVLSRPPQVELASLAEQLKQVQQIARDLVRWTASLDFPPFEHDYEFVALRHESEYPMNEGRLVSNRGLDIAMDEFPDHFEEYQVPYSNALQCRRKGGGAYFVGPLARWNLCADQAGPEIQQLARETGIAWPCRNPYVSIVARASKRHTRSTRLSA